MPQPTSHLFAYVRTVSDFRPDVTAIVLFGLEVKDDDPVYLLIRFEDYGCRRRCRGDPVAEISLPQSDPS